MKTFISAILLFLAFATTNTAKAQTKDTLKTATIKIKGVSCKMDLPIIKKNLVNEEGIDEVLHSEIKSDGVIFTVKYHTAVITEKKIRSVIQNSPCCDNPDEKPYKVKSFKSEPEKK